ncbi:42627_t:CDS:2 [Gigaspora margarita]|uniref:42627_t:CDS:1 n=1 Tax=Gigaspora margarita TaxID=4874 RepID=A0ABN7V356_GIGMA|nr:42627_t:CDS:2 [Gigaspora margarita]
MKQIKLSALYRSPNMGARKKYLSKNNIGSCDSSGSGLNKVAIDAKNQQESRNEDLTSGLKQATIR